MHENMYRCSWSKPRVHILQLSRSTEEENQHSAELLILPYFNRLMITACTRAKGRGFTTIRNIVNETQKVIPRHRMYAASNIRL